MYKNKGRYLRKRSVKNVINELIEAKKKFKNIQLVQIFDDNFITRSDEELELFAKEYRKHIAIPFYCLANPDLVNESNIKILRQAGLEFLQIGIQSGSDRVNYDIYKRKISNKKIYECAMICHENSVSVSFDIIFNNPYESLKDLKNTLDLVTSLPKPFKLNGHNLLFYPDSELTDKALEDEFILRKKSNDVTMEDVKGNRNSPLWFNNDLSNSFFDTNYTSKEKVRLNALITLSQIFPKLLIKILQIAPGDILFYAKFLLSLKKKKTDREKHFYELLSNKELRKRNRNRLTRDI